MLNNYKVYCLTNKINNKKYIGITRRELNERWKNGNGYKKTTRISKAINKYGWNNFIKEVLFENIDNQKASDMEKYYIELYDTINNGYNVQSGGFKDYTTEMSEYHKQCISKANKGKHYSIETEWKKGVYNETSRNKKVPIICIETGIEYESIKSAENKLNLSHHIKDCLSGKRKTCGGYHWELLGGNE